jgi:hypothetical protein
MMHIIYIHAGIEYFYTYIYIYIYGCSKSAMVHTCGERKILFC